MKEGCSLTDSRALWEKSEKGSFVRGMWDVATTERPKVQHIIRLQQPESAVGKKDPLCSGLKKKKSGNAKESFISSSL